MAFKIVQTIEDNVPKLTVVPMHWESDGIVRWPPRTFKNASKLIKNGNSRPGPDWDYLKCVLKRNFIPTYEEANNELCLMQQNTDTDDNDNCSIPAQTFSKRDRANNELNFDAIAAQLSESQTPVVPVSCGQQQETIQIYNSDEIQTVIANQAAIIEQLVTVVENQKKIAFKLASLSIQLEETKASISREQERPVNVTLLQDQLRMEENEAFSITQIENQHQFDILETNLGDKAHKKKLTKTLSLLCSSTDGGGITCAYKLLDVFFTRDFLCKCSWSGGSKGEMSKIPFKNYINFRQFFFEIINSWDSTFTDDDTEKFFKLVVRNATKRKAMKGLRQSTKRTRKSKNHGNVEKRGEEVEVDDESNDNNKEETQANHTSSINEPQAGNEINANQRKESETDKNRKQPEYNKDSSDEEMELC